MRPSSVVGGRAGAVLTALLVAAILLAACGRPSAPARAPAASRPPRAAGTATGAKPATATSSAPATATAGTAAGARPATASGTAPATTTTAPATAATGTAAGSGTATPSATGPSDRSTAPPPATATASLTAPRGQSGARALPSPPFILGFTHGGAGWTLLRPTSAAAEAQLRQIAALLAAAVPLRPVPPGTPALTCGPSGVMTLPAAPLTPHWTLALRAGATVAVVPNVAPCGAASTSYATDAYASLNGRPVRAVGLVPRLLAISETLPRMHPLAVTPAAPAPGSTVRLTGKGWVGGDVVVTVFGCHQLGASDCTVKRLTTLSPDASGRISWQGRLPAALPAARSGYNVSLEAKNGLLDFVLPDIVR